MLYREAPMALILLLVLLALTAASWIARQRALLRSEWEQAELYTAAFGVLGFLACAVAICIAIF